MPSGVRGDSSPAGRDIRPYFFLSYARTPKRDASDRDSPDRWVHKLYKDLCDAILMMTDVTPVEAGFIDAENKVGSEWSPELISAIKNCRVFVPLYSRRYFESDNCGREWFAFAQREVIHRASGGERVDAIVPALWTRLSPDQIPVIGRDLQYAHPGLGERYCVDGFYGIMKMSNHRSAYQLAVHRLAERIIELGDESVTHSDHAVRQMERKDFESLPSAFGPASARRTTNGKLRISVLAHDISTLPANRSPEYYGTAPQSWSPYRTPGYSQPVAEYALDLTRKCLDCDPVVEAFGTEPPGEDGLIAPGLCLIDAWVFMSDSYRERIRQLDETTAPWLSIVVPWNSDDQDLSAKEKLLRAMVTEQLGRKLTSVPRKCHRAAEGIPTIQDLGLVLPEMAMIMLKRYRRDAPAPSDTGPTIPPAAAAAGQSHRARRPNVSTARDGEVITFYSYKGGTGRTMALANVAWIIASSGKHVLVVDWDLESPGLHKFFEPFLEESKVSATPGVIELINDYASEALNRAPRPDDWYRDFARVDKDAHSLDWEFPDGGKLDFLSAGRQNRDYSAAVCSLDWDNFYERLGGGRFFRALREDMKRNYDYILIDSRTGLSDVADICTIELPDVLAVCFTLSNQSIEGAANVARQISGRYRDRNIKVLPVPMRIETGEKEKLDVGRSTARRSFEGFPQGMTQEDLGGYWSGVEVPYTPFYAFEEILATFGDEPGSITSMLASFERIAAAVTSGRVSAMRPIPEDRRLQYRDRFTRRPPAVLTQIHLSYAPEDRMWADWIEAVLTQAGFRVTPCSTVLGQGIDLEAEDRLGSAQRVIAVMSAAYMSSPAARSLWRSLSAADAAGIRRQVVPVRVTDARLAEPFNEITPVDLVRIDAIQATTRLLWVFDRPWQVPGSAQVSGPRFPAGAPRIDNAPSRNHDFTGRAATLEQLRDRLSGGDTNATQALSGLGGVGKTQLAQEYAHRFKADYDLIWWVPAERIEEISVSLADLARQLLLRVGDNVAEAAETALAELRKGTGPRWLLIFDNADNPEQLRPWLPRGNGHVLITSRNKEWTNEAESLGVEVFSRDESISHLLHHVPLLDPGDANQVADALGDLPLAIEQASTWLEQTGMPARAYIEELATRATGILALNQPSGYPTPVVAAWNMSFDRLRDRSPAAVRLLQILAFCSPGGISADLLYSAATIHSLLPYDPALTERLMLGRIIRDISRFALVKVDPGSNLVQIHRLVQAVIQGQMTGEEQLAAQHELHRILFGARPERGETDDPTNWAIFESIWPHLGTSQAEECDDPRTRQLLIDWVRYQWKVGEFESCLTMARRLDATWSRQFGADDQQTLLLRFHIANVLRSQGKYHEARELDRAVLARQRQVLGPEHPNTLMTAGSLGGDQRALGDYQQALESDEATYTSFREQFGDDHPRTLMAATNLAISRRLNGDYAGARTLDQDTLEWRRVVLPADHPYTLDTVANLALVMRAEGEFRDSAELLRTTLDRYRSVLGEDMVESLRTATSLAVSLRKAGDQAEAMKLAQETYRRYEARFGRHSPEARICALNLACDYAADGDFARAVDLAVDVKKALTAGLGPDHPNTLVATNNLACYLRAVGRYAEALSLAEDATTRMRRTLGDRHPMVLSAAINLANCLGDTGVLDAAELLQRNTLEALRQIFGSGHPDTLVCQANLAVTLRELGREQEAEGLAASALAGLERVLGKEHPDLAQLQSGQRVNRDLEPQGI